VLNNLISLSLPLVLYGVTRSRMPSTSSVLLVAPLLASSFYVKSACWVLTDNAALLFSTLTLVALLKDESRIGQSWRASVCAIIATSIRQINIWLVAPTLVRIAQMMLAYRDSQKAGKESARDFTAILIVSSGVVLPLLVVYILIRSWGGLVPEHWLRKNQSENLSVAGCSYLLAVAGVFGVFYVSPAIDAIRAFVHRRRMLWVAGLAGVVCSLMSATSYDIASRRFGGFIWEAVRRLPVVYDRSVVFMALAPLGAVVLAFLARQLWRSVGCWHAAIWTVAVVGWASTSFVNRQAFQRYYEPSLIIFLVLAVAPLVTTLSRSERRLMNWSLSLLFCFQTIVTFFTVYY
jgi:hypothetical protein